VTQHTLLTRLPVRARIPYTVLFVFKRPVDG